MVQVPKFLPLRQRRWKTFVFWNVLKELIPKCLHQRWWGTHKWQLYKLCKLISCVPLPVILVYKMRRKRDTNENHICIKFCFKLHKTSMVTYVMVKLAYEGKQWPELKNSSGLQSSKMVCTEHAEHLWGNVFMKLTELCMNISSHKDKLCTNILTQDVWEDVIYILRKYTL